MPTTLLIVIILIQLVWLLLLTYKSFANSNRINDLQKAMYNIRTNLKELLEGNNTIAKSCNKIETILAKHTGQIKALNVKNFSDKESVAKRKDCKRDRILSNKTTQNT